MTSIQLVTKILEQIIGKILIIKYVIYALLYTSTGIRLHHFNNLAV